MNIFTKNESQKILQILQSEIILNTSRFIKIIKFITRSTKTFDILYYFLETTLNDGERQNFYINILPFIIKSSFICHTRTYNIIKKQLIISKLDVLSILSNMFLCCIKTHSNIEFIDLYNSNNNEINLDNFEKYKESIEERKEDSYDYNLRNNNIEQLKFYLNYFNLIFKQRKDRLDYKEIKLVINDNNKLPNINNNILTNIIFNKTEIDNSIFILNPNKLNLEYPELLIFKYFKKINNNFIQIYNINKFAEYTDDFKLKEINNLNIYNFIFLEETDIDNQYFRFSKHSEILKSFNAFSNIDNDSITFNDFSFKYNDPILNFLIYWLSASLNNKKIKYHNKNKSIKNKIKNLVNEFKNKTNIDLYIYIMQYEKQYLYSI